VVQHPRFRRILDRRSSQLLFDLLKNPPRSFRFALAAQALRRLGGGKCDARGRFYLNVGHTGLDSDGFGRWVRESGVRPIYFVHDLIPITHREFCRSGEAERHRRRIRTVLSTGSGVIGNSQATLDDLTAFAENENLLTPPMVAAWLGTRGAPSGQNVRPPNRPTFVTLGTIEARKNHELLLNVWSRLVAQLGSEAPQLIIIGQRGWEAEEVFRILDEDDTLRGHVFELNRCSDDELSRHLASARALLFPSKAEGYGLPLIEALAMSVPVIASDLPAFREIGQGMPLLLDPDHEQPWAAAILDFAQRKSAARAEQLRRLGEFRPPTWDDHFRRVEHWLGSIR